MKGRIDPMNQFFKSFSSIKGGDIFGEKVNGEDTQRKIVREEKKKASQERVDTSYENNDNDIRQSPAERDREKHLPRITNVDDIVISHHHIGTKIVP